MKLSLTFFHFAITMFPRKKINNNLYNTQIPVSTENVVKKKSKRDMCMGVHMTATARNWLLKHSTLLQLLKFTSLLVLCEYHESGCTLIDLHYSYRIGHSTFRQIVRKVCAATWVVFQ